MPTKKPKYEVGTLFYHTTPSSYFFAKAKRCEKGWCLVYTPEYESIPPEHLLLVEVYLDPISQIYWYILLASETLCIVTCLWLDDMQYVLNAL